MSRLQKASYRILKDLERVLSAALSCASAVGVVVTAVMAAKAVPKAQSLLQEAEEQKGVPLSKPEVVFTAGPVFVPAAICGAATAAGILGAQLLNQRQQNSLAGAYMLLRQSYQRYQKAAKTVYGPDAGEKIRKEMAKETYISADGCAVYPTELEPLRDKILFYELHSQRYFTSTIPAVLNAEYHLNLNLTLRGKISVNEFYTFLGIENIPEGEETGWSLDDMMEAGLMWLDFENCCTKLEDGLECCVISTAVAPSLLNDDPPF